MKKIILSVILGFALVISCEKKQDEHADFEKTTTKQHASDEREDSEEHSEDEKLELNNGAKWTVNAEMKPYVTEMENQISAYQLKDGDYKTLAKNLDESNQNLVKSCTMKGSSHENLHAWLEPHMNEIDKLTKAEDQEKANQIVGELKQSMVTYHQYFD